MEEQASAGDIHHGLQYKVKEDGRIKSKALYSVIGINLEGKKEILGLWIMDRMLSIRGALFI